MRLIQFNVYFIHHLHMFIMWIAYIQCVPKNETRVILYTVVSLHQWIIGYRGVYCNFDLLMSENKLTCSDINMLPSAFTYSSNDHSCTSWIDHILCTTSMNDIIAEVKVLYDHYLQITSPYLLALQIYWRVSIVTFQKLILLCLHSVVGTQLMT